MPKVETVGDVKNLTNYMAEDAKAKIAKVVDEAVAEAEKLLEEKKTELLDRAILDVEKLLSDAEARLNAEKSALEMEKKRKLDELKKRLYQEVIEEAWRKALEEAEKGSDAYKRFLEKALRALSEEAGEDRVIVYVRAQDLEHAKKVAKGLKNVVDVRDVKEIGKEIKGGALGRSESGGVWYNYTLEKFFEEVVREIYPKVLEALGF
ncbi:MAG: hypothetical protein GXO07_02225 [Crenarchaeota archaeon]|nr:hypothetical protein [Thermoproteota archaeon]